jgi:hypothetical protein
MMCCSFLVPRDLRVPGPDVALILAAQNMFPDVLLQEAVPEILPSSLKFRVTLGSSIMPVLSISSTTQAPCSGQSGSLPRALGTSSAAGLHSG